MDREECFCIEGSTLYLEQVLVDHNDIPIFFVCKDDIAYYIVLCADIETLCYIIVKVSNADLYDLLHGRLSMREIFTKQKEYWEVMSGGTIQLDVVVCKPMEQMDRSVLPEEGACFEILTDEISAYVEKIEDGSLSKEHFKTLSQTSDLYDDILNEISQIDLGTMERSIGLYEGRSEKKIEAGPRNEVIEYKESLYEALRPNVTILGNEHPEKWKSSEMKILAYAA